MNMIYKQFNVDNSTYLFCVNDFEIFNLVENKNIENTINEIIAHKENSSLKTDKHKITQKVFVKNNSMNMIGIEIVNGCNLNCTYCYISASSKSRKMLSKESFLEILDFLKNEKNHSIILYFTGAGEPTLNFNLLKQIPNICIENGFNKCSFDLTTNGTIFTDEMIDFFKLNKFTIHISFDGDEKTHNASRIYLDGRGSFNDVFNNIKLLQKNDIEFSCKTVVQVDNKNLINLFAFFEKNKIKFIFSIATNSYDNHFSPNIADLKNFEKQLNIVMRYYKKLIVDNCKIYADTLISDIKRIHYGEINKTGCGGSRDGFFIDIKGNIFPCSYHTKSTALAIGHINTGIDYEKIISKKWYAKPVDSYMSCKECWMKYLCSGSCFAIKWLENQDTDIPSKYLCETYNIYWTAIVELYIQLYPVIINGNNINFIE